MNSWTINKLSLFNILIYYYIMNYRPYLEKVTQILSQNRDLMYFIGYKSQKVTQNVGTKIVKVTQTFCDAL